jgi:hypothetical protein
MQTNLIFQRVYVRDCNSSLSYFNIMSRRLALVNYYHKPSTCMSCVQGGSRTLYSINNWHQFVIMSVDALHFAYIFPSSLVCCDFVLFPHTFANCPPKVGLFSPLWSACRTRACPLAGFLYQIQNKVMVEERKWITVKRRNCPHFHIFVFTSQI